MNSFSYSTNVSANHLFHFSKRAWFGIVVAGQLIFAYYIISLYGVSGIQGNFERWNVQTTHGYVVKDLLGNIIFGLHVFFAAVITICGPIQLIPKIRNWAPVFHRVTGRVYLGSAFLISLAGFYLAWGREAAGGLIGSVFISINGIIILLCAYHTLKFAIGRQLNLHYQWALRLFLAMSGVWFFRVFLMLWLVIHQAPVGFDPESFEGPLLNFLYVLTYILPQVFVTFFFLAKNMQSPVFKSIFAGFLILSGLGILIGIAAATMGMWLPVL